MARTDQIDPEAQYDVELSKPYKLGKTTLSPRNKVTMSGQALIDAKAEVAVKNYAKL